jgi:hypothetical protein
MIAHLTGLYPFIRNIRANLCPISPQSLFGNVTSCSEAAESAEEKVCLFWD